LRYSAKPIEDYGRTIDGEFRGPSTISWMRDDLEAWNLAYLSFNFDARPVCPFPEFGHLVARTMRTDLTTGISHPAGVHIPRQLTVRPFLRQTPREFVTAMLSHPNVRKLPLYKGFGEDWLRVIFERSWIGGEVADDVLQEEAGRLEMQRLMNRLARKVQKEG
jgi:hypothetical protein